MSEKVSQEKDTVTSDGHNENTGPLPASATGKDFRLASGFATALIAGVAGALGATLAFPYFGVANGGQERSADLSPQVVVLDLYGLQQAKLEQVQGADAPFDAVAREAESFARRLEVVLSDYRNAGMVVVNRNAVITAPGMVDVTEVIASRLGVSYRAVMQHPGTSNGISR